MKRLLKTVLAVSAILGVCCLTFPLSVCADSSWITSTENPAYEYQIQDDGTLRLCAAWDFYKYDDSIVVDGVFTIPSHLDGYTVTTVSDIGDTDLIKTIIVPNTVKTVEQYAFWNFEYLETIYFSEGLETIGHFVTFSEHLKEVVIPSTVTVIDASSLGRVSDDPTIPGDTKLLEGFTVYSRNNAAVIEVAQEAGWNHVALDSLSKGDMNRDDAVNIKDAMVLYAMVSGTIMGDPVQQCISDVTGDEATNMADVMMLYQQVAGR